MSFTLFDNISNQAISKFAKIQHAWAQNQYDEDMRTLEHEVFLATDEGKQWVENYDFSADKLLDNGDITKVKTPKMDWVEHKNVHGSYPGDQVRLVP